jgi:hypothetical protein
MRQPLLFPEFDIGSTKIEKQGNPWSLVMVEQEQRGNSIIPFYWHGHSDDFSFLEVLPFYRGLKIL